MLRSNKRKSNINFPTYVWGRSDFIRSTILKALPEHTHLLNDAEKWRLLFVGVAVGTKLKMKEATKGENKEILADALSLDRGLEKVILSYSKFYDDTLPKLDAIDELHGHVGYWLVYQLNKDGEPTTEEIQDFSKVLNFIFGYINDYRTGELQG